MSNFIEKERQLRHKEKTQVALVSARARKLADQLDKLQASLCADDVVVTVSGRGVAEAVLEAASRARLHALAAQGRLNQLEMDDPFRDDTTPVPTSGPDEPLLSPRFKVPVKDLEDLALELTALLYGEQSQAVGLWFNPEKEWDGDTLQELGLLSDKYKLWRRFGPTRRRPRTKTTAEVNHESES